MVLIKVKLKEIDPRPMLTSDARKARKEIRKTLEDTERLFRI